MVFPKRSRTFLISTGWAYRFETHPAWKTSILPIYYIASAIMIGLVLRAMYYPLTPLPFLYAILLVTEAFLLLLYRNHLRKTSPSALEDMVTGTEKRLLLAFLWTTLILPAILTTSFSSKATTVERQIF
jgi:DMSO reductase anchor subunit